MNRAMVGLAAVAITGVAGVGALTQASAGASGYTDPCTGPLPTGSAPANLDPSNFVDSIDNLYWPMAVGSKWTLQETDGRGRVSRVRVEVKDRTKNILGISATVVRDTVTRKGALVEDTRDWYAQDVCGNMWYLGENTKEYKGSHVVSTEGSWEAGVDGAEAGIALPGDPVNGLAYRQEYKAGEAEDSATVLSLGDQVTVPFGHVRNVVVTKDYTSLSPRVLEYKFYARGIGPVEEIGLSGGSDRAVLKRFVPGG